LSVVQWPKEEEDKQDKQQAIQWPIEKEEEDKQDKRQTIQWHKEEEDNQEKRQAIPWREHNTFTQVDDNISFVIDKFTYLNLIVLAYWKQQSTSRRIENLNMCKV
jgi:hypothetical protein